MFGFRVLPRRRGARTVGQINHWRRLSKGYEQVPQTSEPMIYAAMSLAITRRSVRY
jgi:putative transposase